VKFRMPPKLIFAVFIRFYSLRLARSLISFAHGALSNAPPQYPKSKPYGIIRPVKKLCIFLAIVFPLLSAASHGTARTQATPNSPSTVPDKSLIAQGRARYLSYKCDECHGPNGQGGGDGPDLTATLLSPAEISKFLEKPSPDADMKGMPNIPTDNPDHQALVAYVLSLKRQANPDARPAQPSPAPHEEPQKSPPPSHHKLSATEKAHLLDGDFAIEYKVERLPGSLKSAFARLAKQPEFKMANPGEKFEATDNISDPALPTRRLIFAGISKNRYFIHYGHGGIGYHCDVVVFDVNPEGIVSFLGAGSGRAKDLAQLRALVSSNAFGNSDNHW
jgi:mono/diheme cytochrome c family protein